MTKEQEKVLEFHKRFDCYIGQLKNLPNLPPKEVLKLRFNLIDEEVNELEAGLIRGNVEEIVDALGDLLYVIYGFAVTLDIDMEPIFNEIHRSNMSKLWPDGTVRKRMDGKVLKPKTYSPPCILDEIDCQLDAQE